MNSKQVQQRKTSVWKLVQNATRSTQAVSASLKEADVWNALTDATV